MAEYKSIEEIEKKYTPEDIKKYPVVLRIRVTQREVDTIKEWVMRRR